MGNEDARRQDAPPSSWTDRKTEIVLFSWILLAGLLGCLCGLPWAFAVVQHPSTAWLEAGVSLLMLIPGTAAGVWLGKKAGLDSGLRELVSGAPGGSRKVLQALPPALFAGFMLGVFGLIGQSTVPKEALIPGMNNPNILEWFLRCISAALTEEIAFRFGFMTFLAWVIMLMAGGPAIRESHLWLGNLLSSLLFAVAHLPQLDIQQSGLGLVILTIAANSGAGVLMGWIFMRYGLVSAITAHFVADLLAHVVPRL
jgi:hypothetical protein